MTFSSYNWYVYSSGVWYRGTNTFFSYIERSYSFMVIWYYSIYQWKISPGKYWLSQWKAKKESQYNPMVQESLLAEESTTSTTSTKYQRLRIIFSGIYWMNKRSPYILILLWIFHGVKRAIDTDCDSFLTGIVFVIPPSRRRYFIDK